MYRRTFGAIAALVAIAPAACAQAEPPAVKSGIDVVVALDNSGSMASSDPKFLLRAAISRFAADLRPDDRCAVVIFGDGSQLALSLTARTDADFGQNVGVSLNGLNYREQYTDIPGGFAQALYELREHGRKSAQHVVVLVTDGFVDLRDRAQIAGRKLWLEQDLRTEAEGSVRVFGVAFTAAADLQLLQSLATATQGDYKKVEHSIGLENALSEIRGEMSTPPSGHAPLAQEPVIRPTKQPQSGPSLSTVIWVSAASLAGAVFAAGLALLVMYRISLRRNEARETIPKDQRGFLRPLTGEGEIIEIIRIRTLIGRKDSSDVALHEDTVSQPQASMEFRDGGFYLHDLRSRYGTSVHPVDQADPHRVDPMQPEPLKHGDIIRFGKVSSFVFETLAGGGTTFAEPDGTLRLPASCYYHPGRQPQQFCRSCQHALCGQCFASHPCPAKAQVGG